MKIVSVESLTKCYGDNHAVDEATWSLSQGRLLGFLGPNGAGKTTTIRILLGLLKCDSGDATIFGMHAWQDSVAIRKRLGYLPGDVRLYPDLNGRQHIQFAAAARKMPDMGDAYRLADIFQLDLDTTARNCSKGMRQKIGLILAMLHKPDLLILDEPTSALDPLMQHVLYEELRNAAKVGRTVLFSSHSLAEVESLCEDVVILRNGKVVASTAIETLRSKAPQRVILRFKEHHIPPADELPTGLTTIRTQNSTLHARWQGLPRDLFSWLATQPIDDAVLEPPNLEDLFLEFYDTKGCESKNTPELHTSDSGRNAP